MYKCALRKSHEGTTLQLSTAISLYDSFPSGALPYKLGLLCPTSDLFSSDSEVCEVFWGFFSILSPRICLQTIIWSIFRIHLVYVLVKRILGEQTKMVDS
jgi:hypothetical protein